MDHPGVPRPAVAGLPAYRPGRSAEMAMREHALTHAIKLASNELPWGPVPAAREAITAAVAQGHLYADHGALALRRALAERAGLDPAQVTAGCGSVGLLQQLYLTYCDPGDPVVYAWPSFEAYPVFAGLTGAVAHTPPLRRQTYDLAALATEAGRHRGTKLVMVANPNNPTGTAAPLADIVTLLESVPPGCLVVLDEAYREFVTRTDLPDTVHLLSRYPHLVILRTFSKAWGLAGLRVGYAFAHPSVIEAVDKTLAPFAVNGLGQVAALASLSEEAVMLDRVATVTAERARVASALRTIGWSVADPQANFVWLPCGAAASDLSLALEQRGVVTRGFPGVGIRVTIADQERNDVFLAAFADAAAGLDPSVSTLPTGAAAAAVDELVMAVPDTDPAGAALRATLAELAAAEWARLDVGAVRAAVDRGDLAAATRAVGLVG